MLCEIDFLITSFYFIVIFWLATSNLISYSSQYTARGAFDNEDKYVNLEKY